MLWCLGPSSLLEFVLFTAFIFKVDLSSESVRAFSFYFFFRPFFGFLSLNDNKTSETVDEISRSSRPSGFEDFLCPVLLLLFRFCKVVLLQPR